MSRAAAGVELCPGASAIGALPPRVGCVWWKHADRMGIEIANWISTANNEQLATPRMFARVPEKKDVPLE